VASGDVALDADWSARSSGIRSRHHCSTSRSRRLACHYEWDRGDTTLQRPRRSGQRLKIFDRAERTRARTTLAAARNEWNSIGGTDLEPVHVPADPWTWE
jgi:hypothetical protein